MEGEGSFILNKNGSLVMSGPSTDLDVLESIKDSFGGKIYYLKVSSSMENRKDVWCWKEFGWPAALLMGEIMPYMESRRYKKITNCLDGYAKSCNIMCNKGHQKIGKNRSSSSGGICIICRKEKHMRKNNADWKYGDAPRKLCQEDADKIRLLYGTKKYFLSDLAKMFDISASSVHRVIHNKAWK